MTFHTVPAPHINANDLNMTVVGWEVAAWSAVAEGDLICQVETTKATVEIEATAGGFVYPAAAEGSLVKVGEPLAYIFPSDDPAQLEALSAGDAEATDAVISKKARALMAEHGLTAADFPRHTTISADTVIAALRERTAEAGSVPGGKVPKSVPAGAVVLVGELNLCTLIYDALLSNADAPEVAGWVNTGGGGPAFFGLEIFAPDQLPALREAGLARCAVGGAPAAVRERVQALGLRTETVVHAAASVSSLAELGAGVFIGAGAVIGPMVSVGDGATVLAGASVAHHSRIAPGATISDGTFLGGNVSVGAGALVGIGAVVNKRVDIGDGATVVSGAAVTDHVPARHVWRLDGTCADLT